MKLFDQMRCKHSASASKIIHFKFTSPLLSLTRKSNNITRVCYVLLCAFLLQTGFAANAKALAVNIIKNAPAAATIKGTVTDNQGIPLPGVNIMLKGTTLGVTSDVQGHYSINVPDDNGVLVFSFIGFATQEIPIGGRTTVDAKMAEDRKALNEVVVIGYGTAKKGDLTGSVSSVSAADIDKVPVTSIDQSMQGRAAGVQVTTNNGSPGGSIQVQIRGIGSFGNNSPLYVVDGYPISGGLQSINPNDVQSIDILKDASSAAIYGNRASNGVVIITTKRGKANGGVQVSFDATTSVQFKPQKYDVINAEQFVNAAKTVFVTDAATKAPILPEWQNNPASFFADKNIDWQDIMMQNGLRQNYNFALRGGGEKVQSSFSLGYFNQTGIERFSSFKRYNASINLDYTPYTWLKASTNIKYTNGNRDDRGSGLQQFLFLQPVMTGRPGVYQPRADNGVYGYYTKGAQATQSNQTNIYADLEERYVDNPSDNVLASGSLEATILPGLKAKTSLGINSINSSNVYFQPGNDRAINNSAPLAFYRQNNNSSNEWLWENTLSFNRTFGKHSIDAVAGISAQENKFRTTYVAGNGSISNDVLSGANGNYTSISETRGYTEYWSLYSQFARLSYKYNDKYILTGSVRRDGSSRFGDGKKYGVFPTAGVAWKIKEESFMKDLTAINDFTLRASWGKAGNQNIGLFKYQGPYTLGPTANDNRGYVFGTTKTYYQGLALNALPNPNLTWETNTQSNIALDMAFLNNKLTATIEYYKRVSSDFLLDVPVPAQTGFQTAQRNVGEMQNNGFELSIKYRDYDRTFKWAVGINGSTIKNKINSFAEGLNSMYASNTLGLRGYGSSLWTQYALSQVGGTINAFYGYKTAGIFQDQASIDALNAASVAKFGTGNYYQALQTAPGDRKFVDLNGDGRINALDRTIIGNPLPDFFGGITLDAAYKQFDFSAFVYASVGNDIFNYSKMNLQNFDAADGVGYQSFGTDFYNNHWTPQNHSTTYSRLVFHDYNGNNRPSDAYVEDGSFARLKTIQVGYTLPNEIAKKLRMNKFRIYVSGQNLFTISKYSGLDPEVGNVGSQDSPAIGVDQGNYPTSKYITVGLNATF
jgi:TonB-linked SusC/RagA family outer membrane protein